MRLILDGTVVRVRLDRKATAISLLVVIGVRADGQKVLLAIKSMGGESTEAWRAVIDDLIQRGLQRPQFLIVDGAPGLEAAIAAVWGGVPVQRCTVGSLKKCPSRRFMRLQARRQLHGIGQALGGVCRSVSVSIEPTSAQKAQRERLPAASN